MRKQILHKVLLLLLGLTSLGLIVFLPGKAQAANPATISFQGKIVNSNGTNVADGTYSIVFRIYNTASPTMTTSCTTTASCLWEGTQSSVSVANGIFQVELGSACALTSSSCNNTAGGPINYASTNSLYLTMQFAGDTSGSNGGFMYPLIHINSVPFALYSDNSGNLGGIASSNYLQFATGTVQTDSTTNNSVVINKTGASGDILLLEANSKKALEVNNSGTVLLGQAGASGLNGTLTFNNGTGSHTVSLALQADPGSSYTLLLPTTGPSTSQCLQTDSFTANQLKFAACSTGGGVTSVSYSTSNNASGASIAGSALTIYKADGSNPGFLSADAQTIGGDKTLTGTTSLTPSGSNVGTIIKQTSGTATSGNILDIQGSNGTSHFIQIAQTAANAGSIAITSLGSNDLTLDSGSATLKLGSTTTTLQKSATSFTLDVNNASNSTFSVTNAGAGVASLSVEGGITGGGNVTAGANSSFTTSSGTSTYTAGTTSTLTSASGTTVTAASGQNVTVSSAGAGTISVTSAAALTLQGSTASLDSASTGAVNVGTGANAKTTTIGSANTTSTTNIQSGSGNINLLPGAGNDVVFSQGAGSNLQLNASAGTTVDQLSISNASGATSITGVDGLAVNFNTTGTTASADNSGIRIDVTSNNSGASTTLQGLKISDLASSEANSTETGVYVGTGWDIGLDLQSGGIELAAQSDPATPSAGNLMIYAKDIAGRVIPKWVGPAGVDTPFQANFGFNRIAMMSPAGSGTTCSTSLSIYGSTTSGAGTCSYPALASTNLFSSVRRFRYSTGTTAGTVAYQRQAALMTWRGNAAGLGGFFFTTRFGISTLQSGNRAFVGLADSIGTPTNVDPTTSTTPGKIGMAINANTGNWNFVTNITGTAPTVTALGSNFPVNTTDLYELILFSAPNGSSIGWRVTDLSTGQQTSGSASTNIPSSATFLNPIFWITNNATAAAANLDLAGWYLESDN